MIPEDKIEKLLTLEAPKIVQTMRDGLLLLDSELRVVFANKSFYSIFKSTPKDTLGAYIYDLGSGQWNTPPFGVLLKKRLRKNKNFTTLK